MRHIIGLGRIYTVASVYSFIGSFLPLEEAARELECGGHDARFHVDIKDITKAGKKTDIDNKTTDLA